MGRGSVKKAYHARRPLRLKPYLRGLAMTAESSMQHYYFRELSGEHPEF